MGMLLVHEEMMRAKRAQKASTSVQSDAEKGQEETPAPSSAPADAPKRKAGRPSGSRKK